MKTIIYRGWAVAQSCIVNCTSCGESTVDHSSGTPREAVQSARNNGWKMIEGKIVCDYCLEKKESP